MSIRTQLDILLEDLVDGWCARRALDPLRRLLPGYPMHMGLSDEWHLLWNALRNVKGLPDPILQDGERRKVEEALRIIERAMGKAGQAPVGPSA